MGVVKFDIDEFKEMYPIEISNAQLNMCFLKAELRLNNTESSLVCDLGERKILLYLLTAHLGVIQDRINKGNDSVGRVSSASEGSVSVSLEFPTGSSLLAAWFAQTPYGAEYWMLTSKYRSMIYMPGTPSMRVRRSW